ncbi:PepSY-associated TM helix domain-containing protein [Stakelama saccharophila]|uniref:PepSY-associated TM helix domain-containing protein n=1 Tax=Stakelama saccharophila TaxID=3075605 RepID=A0ABZ0B9H8_9SPHN|nr:PepSY-associated TM helix domain-containing protein [Stakelama sp. W311]WNO54044.1 PepSY-associated TM helix domain-containing protein [Stakelama sp. W311]
MLHSGEAVAPVKRRRRRVSPFWTKQFHLWHWMSSAICLVGMLLFAVTGITLNHAATIGAEPRMTTREAQLPPSLLATLAGDRGADDAPVPGEIADWSSAALSASIAGRPAEWSKREVYVPLPQPGGDGWVSINRTSGEATYEHTDRGWVAWLNDLHKGRDTGPAWRWFIDIFAAACVIFCLTGFLLLKLHARHRKATWPLVGGGLVIPILLIILFVHA